jgi:hypothetical protein
MDPDLVGAAAARPERDQRDVRRVRDDPAVGRRRPPGRVDPHPPAVLAVRAERRVEGEPAWAGPAPDHRQVDLGHPPLAERAHELPVHVGVERDEDEARGRLVEPVHEVQLAPLERLPVGRRQRRDQPPRRRVAARARRRQREARRLVEDREAVAQVDEARRQAQWRSPPTK